MKRLQNKVAVITGGAQGIGKATTQTYLNEGASVAIWDIDENNGTKLRDELKNNGFDVEFFKVNVADYNDVQNNVKAVLAKFGTIDILVNNAGITRDATLKKMTPEQWKQVIDVNLTGVFNCTQLISQVM